MFFWINIFLVFCFGASGFIAFDMGKCELLAFDMDKYELLALVFVMWGFVAFTFGVWELLALFFGMCGILIVGFCISELLGLDFGIYKLLIFSSWTSVLLLCLLNGQRVFYWFRTGMCGLFGIMCERSEFQDGTVFKFIVKENGNIKQRIMTTEMLLKDKRNKGYVGHFHINGVNTTIDKLKMFYSDMYCYANNTEIQVNSNCKYFNNSEYYDDQKCCGGRNYCKNRRGNIPVYFIYNCTSIWRGFREKFLVGKTWGRSVDSIYENNPAAKTLYKLASLRLVKHVSAHSNGNVVALSAFHQLNNDESRARVAKGRGSVVANRVQSALKNITYHALSLQAHNNFIKPEILSMLGKNTTYYFNLEESYSSMFKLNTIPVEVITEFIKMKKTTEGNVTKKMISDLSRNCKELGPRIGAFKNSLQKMYYIFNLDAENKFIISLPFRILAWFKEKSQSIYPIMGNMFFTLRLIAKLRYLVFAIWAIYGLMAIDESIASALFISESNVDSLFDENIFAILLSLIQMNWVLNIIEADWFLYIIHLKWIGFIIEIKWFKYVVSMQGLPPLVSYISCLIGCNIWFMIVSILSAVITLFLFFSLSKEHDSRVFCLRSWGEIHEKNNKRYKKNFKNAII